MSCATHKLQLGDIVLTHDYGNGSWWTGRLGIYLGVDDELDSKCTYIHRVSINGRTIHFTANEIYPV